MTNSLSIIGAGLSGLMAATQFQSAVVFESNRQEDAVGHKALLRFRSSAVADAIGIEFRQVRVHKGIWDGETFVQPSILHANRYSQKVLGRLGDRSIWNLEPVDRFIAPESLMEQLIERVGSRIEFGTDYVVCQDEAAQRERGSVVSTIPMSVLVKALQLKQRPAFSFAPIHVSRYRIANADVFQTVYFPNEYTDVYRASMTGDVLIIESMEPVDRAAYEDVLEAFGIDQVSEPLGATEQRFGKIAPIDDAWRRKFIAEATRRMNIYSLGRFAVWRNILADDVLKDIAVIKRLLRSDAYTHRMQT